MTWRVPVLSQSTLNLCWEACGRMLWGWRHTTSPQSWTTYATRAGRFGTLNTGLAENQMDGFYLQLGIRSLQAPQGKNIRHALKWSPVIITSVHQAQGHAMVVVGHTGSAYTIINPCGVQAVDFDTGVDSCSAATTPLPLATVDGALGQYIWYW
jgi:Papain-like cysteine protease AvrRpt2